ncbi:MAG: ribonuclease III [Chloroflexi bacterium]|nr:ribonuclease III [Chloroflexota bacterium]
MKAFVPLEEVEKTIGVVFRDKSLLQRALTHRSYLNEVGYPGWEDNERLEFLGDAIIDCIVAEHLYHKFPEMSEGMLTAIRSNLVKKEALAAFARKIRLGDYLIMSSGEASSGGRDRDATLCAAFEALVGALYLDQGIEVAREFVLSFVREALDDALEQAVTKDAKTRLQEWSQAVLHKTPRYVTEREEGPDHAKVFTIAVYVGDVVAGRGQGASKQAAAQAAAEDALAHRDERLAALMAAQNEDRDEVPSQAEAEAT